MRWLAGALVLLVAACSGAVQTTGGSLDSATSAEPSDTLSPPLHTPTAPSSGAAGAGKQTVRSVGTDGAPLGYLEYLPPTYGNGDSPPLLIFLHGAGEAGDGSEKSLALVDDLGIPQLIADGDWPEDRPFIVLSPQYGTRYAEGDCDLANAIGEFLAFAKDQYELDASRVYLTGISCGAIGVWDYLAAQAGAGVAASVTISGHGAWAFEKAGCALAGMPPMWAFHGATDDVVPLVHIEGPLEQIAACDGVHPSGLKLTVYPDADHVTAIHRTYDGSAGHDIYAWMLDHTSAP